MTIGGITISVVSIVLFIIFLLLFFRGIQKGILGMLIGIITWVLVIALSAWLYPTIETAFQNSNNLAAKMQETADNQVTKQEEKLGLDQWLQSITSASDAQSENLKEKGLVLPSFMADKYNSAIEDGANAVDNAVTSVSESVHNALVDTLSEYLLKGLALIVTILILVLIVAIVTNVIKLIGHLPVLRTTSRLLGGLVGAFEGLLVIWLVIYIAEHFAMTALGSLILQDVNQNPVLQVLNTYNVFKFIFA